MIYTEVKNNDDGPKGKSSPIHICQIIAGRAEKECLAISNLNLSTKTVNQPTTAEIHLKPVSLKDKMQAWDMIIRESKDFLLSLQFVNVGHRGFCLGSNSIKSLGSFGGDQLFAEKNCDKNAKVQWSMEPVWDLNAGQQKCLYEE